MTVLPSKGFINVMGWVCMPLRGGVSRLSHTWHGHRPRILHAMAEGGPLPHLIDGLDYTSAELIYNPANTADGYAASYNLFL